MVRFSGVAPFFGTLRADTSANIRSDFDAGLLGVGWTHVSTLSNGFIYQCQSPEGLFARCRIQDTGGTTSEPLGTTEHYIEVEFRSGAGGTSTGGVHWLIYSATNTDWAGGYQMIAGPCQFFVSMPGHTGEQLHGGHTSNSVAGGVLALPPNTAAGCNVATPTVNELWWSCGIDHDGKGCIRNQRYFQDQWDFCLNGTLTTQYDQSHPWTYDMMPLQLLPLTITRNTDFWNASYTKVTKYNDSTPLVIDALMAFKWQVVGQLWDAFQKSRDTTLDEVVTTTEVDINAKTYAANWQAWNYMVPFDGKGGTGTWWATLYLLKSIPLGVTPCNYAY